MACKHTCGSKTRCAWGGPLWNRAFVKGACSPPSVIIFFTAIINVASTRFKAEKGIMDALVHLRKKEGAGGRGEATAGESAMATPLWGMLYADDARVVSQSPEQPRKMAGVIVVVCAAFGVTVPEARTEIMCLRAKGLPESTAIFSVEAADRCTTRRTSLYISGGTSTTMPTCPSRSTGAYAMHSAASGSTPSNCTTDRALPSSSNSGC